MTLSREIRRTARRLGNRCRATLTFLAAPWLCMLDALECLLLHLGVGEQRTEAVVRKCAAACSVGVVAAGSWAWWQSAAAPAPLPAATRAVVIRLDYGFITLCGALLQSLCTALLVVALLVHRCCACCISIALHWPWCSAIWLAASCTCSLVGVEPV